MSWRRARRRARASGLRCLRVVRRHYFSLLSALVLAIALAAALTNSGFEVDRPGAPAPPGEAAAAVSPSPTVAPVASPTQSVPSVVYYFIDSESARNEMQMALHRDLADESLRNYAPLHKVTRIFVMIEDARDEAEALEFLRQLAHSPPTDGTLVRVVDLR